MVLIVPLVGPTAFGFVFLLFSYGFVWFSYGFVRFSYGSNRPPRWSDGFRVRFLIVFLWFCMVFLWFCKVFVWF